MSTVIEDRFSAQGAIEERYTEKLREYERFLDSKEFNIERNKQFEGELRTLREQLEARKTHAQAMAQERSVIGISHRAAPGSYTEHRSTTADPREANPEMARRAFNMALKRGLPYVKSDPELRTYAPLDSVTGANGAFLVPTLMGPEIEKKMKSVGAILSIVRNVQTDNGDLIDWPTLDDTTNSGEFIAQNAPVGQQNPVFGQVPISAFQWDSKQVLAPLSLLQDSKFDIAGLLADLFAERAGRDFSNRVMNDATDGILSTGNVGSTSTAASATLLNYFEPLNLQGNIDLAYNIGATYVMSLKTYLGYRSLVSTTGQALWPEADYKAGIFHGKPFIISQHVPDFGTTGNKYLLYGDFSKVIFRRVSEMSVFRFNELFMSNLQQAFQAFQRVAGKVIQPAALTLLKAA